MAPVASDSLPQPRSSGTSGFGCGSYDHLPALVIMWHELLCNSILATLVILAAEPVEALCTCRDPLQQWIAP